GHWGRRALVALQGEGQQPEQDRVERQESSAATADVGKRNRCCGFRRIGDHAVSTARRAGSGDGNRSEEQGSNTRRAPYRGQWSRQTERAAERELDCSDGTGISSSDQSPAPRTG